MRKEYYTYRIRVLDRNKVLVEKRGPENEEIGFLEGDFGYKGKLREEIDSLSLTAQEGELKDSQVEALGEKLFHALIDPVLRLDFGKYYDEIVHKTDQLLRIEIDIDERELPDVVALPWEFMRLPTDANQGVLWLGTAPRVILSRHRPYMFTPKPVELRENESLRIALVVSSPRDQSVVAYEDTLTDLQKLTKDFPDQFELITLLEKVNPENLNSILKQKPHIFHFVGHGRFESNEEDRKIGQIALETSLRTSNWVDAKYFSDLFNQHRPSVALLQACQGGASSASQAFVGIASQVVQQNIPVVVAMQYTVTNVTASRFARHFYRKLVDGLPVDAAAQAGRRHIAHGHYQYTTRDFATPILFTQVNSGYLFRHVPSIPGEHFKTSSSIGKETVSVSYNDLINASDLQLERYYNEINILTSSSQYASFNENVYIERENVAQHISAFLSGEKSSMLLLGESGVGKTNVLCNLVKQLKQENHIVLFYDLGSSVQSSITNEIAEDLETTRERLSEKLGHIDLACQSTNKNIVVVFDALNEYRSKQRLAVAEALRQLDNFIAHNTFNSLKIVISCRKDIWDQLEVRGETKLIWSNYYSDGEGSSKKLVVLNLFNEEEVEKAYIKYKDEFKLYSDFDDLSIYTKKRCKDPFLLRLLSEIYEEGDMVIPSDAPSYDIIRLFYDTRVKRRRDKHFLSILVRLMYQNHQEKLALGELESDPNLGPAVLDDSLESPYLKLKDAGILIESPDRLFVSFSHDRVLEYVLAQDFLTGEFSKKASSSLLNDLVQEAKSFFALWGVVKNILVLKKELVLYIKLARSRDLSARKVVIEALVKLSEEDLSIGLEFIEQLLEVNSDGVQVTALEAAYYLGKDAKEIFLLAAVHDSDLVREVVRGYLYILWKSDPEFCYNILDDLILELNVLSPSKSIDSLSFILDYLSLQLINNCWRPEVVERISAQIEYLVTNKLHLDKLSSVPMGRQIEDIVFSVGGKVISKKVFETVMFNDYFPVEDFFLDTSEERNIYNQLVSILDPEISLPPDIKEDLTTMMEADIILYKLISVLIMAGHLYGDFYAYAQLIREVFDDLSPTSRYWLISAFSVYLPIDLPYDYVLLIQELTNSYLKEHRQHFVNFEHDSFYVPGLELLFLPLGLANLMRDKSLSFFSDLFSQARATNDTVFLAHCVRYVAPIGLYYPDETLELLSAVLDVQNSSVQGALVNSLATIRTLYLEKVDGFMERSELKREIFQDVVKNTALDRVSTHLYAIGLYNNAINMMLWHPKLCDTFSYSIYQILASAKGMSDFVEQYSRRAYDDVKANDWKMINLFNF